MHLQIDKAHHQLSGVRVGIFTTVARTVAWYRSVHAGASTLECCLADLEAYQQDSIHAAELQQTTIDGVFELVSQVHQDSRGCFLNSFRAHEEAFLSSWGDRGIAQVNISRNEVKGTIRGFHLQASPHSEAKMVRCLNGRVWDVAVDLRSDSPTYCQWHAVELSPDLSMQF